MRTVVVVDDQAAFADAISLAIDLQPDLRCLATMPTAEAALGFLQTRCADVVLLDLALPGMTGIEAIAPLRATCPQLRVVVLTANTTGDSVLAAAQAGADRFLPKERPFAEVLDALRGVDQPLVPTSVARLLRQAGDAGPGGSPGPAVELSERERDVLMALADGKPVKAIARELGISVNTCRNHVRALLAKFDAHSQLAAVVKAARAGMIPSLGTGGRRNGVLAQAEQRREQ